MEEEGTSSYKEELLRLVAEKKNKTYCKIYRERNGRNVKKNLRGLPKTAIRRSERKSYGRAYNEIV